VNAVLVGGVLDRIEAIVPPATDICTYDHAYVPPPIQKTHLRRPLSERPPPLPVGPVHVGS
jgi:hypothetical protein